jgi:integrase
MIHAAIEAGTIAPEQRFGLHGLKHRGITDTAGNRADKQDASGHKSAAMLDVYDHALPVVNPAGGE